MSYKTEAWLFAIILCIADAGQLSSESRVKTDTWYQLVDGRHCVASVSPTAWAASLVVLGAPFRISASEPGSPVLIANGSHAGADMRVFFSDEDQCIALRHSIDDAYSQMVIVPNH